ncbi:MAG TPA: TonB family protein [Candidatus Sumerlaeota bacterium]|nr:TonB family protein [Candidatus Sumerlaeota bacterium]HOR28562.1 TonB family protein [Candidatus Sumerlaeota bacterium]
MAREPRAFETTERKTPEELARAEAARLRFESGRGTKPPTPGGGPPGLSFVWGMIFGGLTLLVIVLGYFAFRPERRDPGGQVAAPEAMPAVDSAAAVEAAGGTAPPAAASSTPTPSPSPTPTPLAEATATPATPADVEPIRQALAASDWNRARTLAEAALKTQPGDPQIEPLLYEAVYQQQTALARGALEQGQWITAQNALGEAMAVRPDDPALEGMLRRLPRLVLPSVEQDVFALALAGGERVAAALKYEQLAVYGLKPPHRIQQVEGGRNYQAAFSPDLSRAAAAARVSETTSELALYDLQTGRRTPLTGAVATTVESLEYSPAGNWIAAAATWPRRQLTEWGFGDELAQAEREGRLRASATELPAVVLWGTEDARPARLLLPGGEGERIDSIAFSPDEKRVASSLRGGQIMVQEVDDGRIIQFLPAPFERRWLSYAPRGNRLFVTDTADAVVIDLDEARTMARIESEPAGIRAWAFTPDGELLAVAGEGAPIRFHDVETGRELARLGEAQGRFHDLDFSPDGRWLAAGGAQPGARLVVYPVDPAAIRQAAPAVAVPAAATPNATPTPAATDRLIVRPETDAERPRVDLEEDVAYPAEAEEDERAAAEAAAEDEIRVGNVAAGGALTDLGLVYATRVLEAVNDRFQPPRSRRGARAVIEVIIAPDGRLEKPQLIRSAGRGELDRAALRAIARARAPRPPEDSRGRETLRTVRLTFNF